MTALDFRPHREPVPLRSNAHVRGELGPALPAPALRAEIALLRDARTLDELRAGLCGAVVRACGLERALLSDVVGRTWRPMAWYSRPTGSSADRFPARLDLAPVLGLAAGSAEARAIDTRTVVPDDGFDSGSWFPGAPAALLLQGPRLVAPILSEGRAIGLLHADRRGGWVGSCDAQTLAAFLDVFTLLVERAAARRHISQEQSADRSERSAHRLAELTAREVEVLAAMATGAPNAQIAVSLSISTTTVKSHVRRILRALEVSNRGGAIVHYLQHTR